MLVTYIGFLPGPAPIPMDFGVVSQGMKALSVSASQINKAENVMSL